MNDWDMTIEITQHDADYVKMEFEEVVRDMGWSAAYGMEIDAETIAEFHALRVLHSLTVAVWTGWDLAVVESDVRHLNGE